VQYVGAGGQTLTHHAGPATAGLAAADGRWVQAKIFFITWAADLDRSVAFCGDGSGWPAGGIAGPEVVQAAIGAGLSRSEVHRLTGMARTTIGRIAGTVAALEATRGDRHRRRVCGHCASVRAAHRRPGPARCPRFRHGWPAILDDRGDSRTVPSREEKHC
jgi:hypothetical protein